VPKKRSQVKSRDGEGTRRKPSSTPNSRCQVILGSPELPSLAAGAIATAEDKQEQTPRAGGSSSTVSKIKIRITTKALKSTQNSMDVCEGLQQISSVPHHSKLLHERAPSGLPPMNTGKTRKRKRDKNVESPVIPETPPLRSGIPSSRFAQVLRLVANIPCIPQSPIQRQMKGQPSRPPPVWAEVSHHLHKLTS
jgi:hypothetical protein